MIPRKKSAKTERNMQIVADRQQGMTYKQLADKYNIGITRVRQILEEWNETK